MGHSTFSALLILLSSGSVQAKYNNSANFDVCINIVQSIDDATYHSVYNNGTFWDFTKRYLSLDGCYALCGSGFEIWPLKDTVDRVSLWVLPALILLTHFCFAKLGINNHFAVILHAIGDPIDSIWSLLTRYEAHRRLLRTADQIWNIYPSLEQLVQEDADTRSDDDRVIKFLRAIKLRGLANFISKRRYPAPSSMPEHIAAISAAYEEHGGETAICQFERVIDDRHKAGRQLMSPKELLSIKRASHQLAKHRSASPVMALVPILSLALGLASAINRTIQQSEASLTRLSNETSHTIALLSLFFVFIPMVSFSGTLGVFSTVTGAAEILQDLRQALEEESGSGSPLFSILETFSHCCHEDHDATSVEIDTWPHLARYSGMNSTYRRCKYLLQHPENESIPNRLKHVFLPWTRKGPDRSHDLLLCYSLIFVIFGASIPAIFLSATNHADERVVAVGCRTLCWLGISGLWMTSTPLTWATKFRYSEPKTRWRRTIYKDGAVVFLIFVAVVLMQIGIFNSCWCRASFYPWINIMPYQDWEWRQTKARWGSIAPAFFVFDLAIIAWIVCRGGRKMSVLCRSQKQMQQDAKDIASVRRRLDGKGEQEKLVKGGFKNGKPSLTLMEIPAQV
jgi:hypothetical protein